MQLGIVLMRATTVVAFVNMCVAENSSHNLLKKAKRPGKYLSKVYDLYQNQIEKKPKVFGQWSAWSPWSTCSRSCGGGITQQIRHCVNRPADSRFVKRQRRRRQNWKPSNECVGLYKRIHLCNTQDCPANNRDFRYEQCEAFNQRPFKGRTYHWEPFYQGKAECALNCRPRGLSFYATLNKTVIDGTPCYHPVTSTGKAAPKGSRGVCIDGYCRSVNAQGVVGGSDENGQQCFACLRGACRTFDGIYTRPDLPPGYSLVVQIPKGACGLHVQQIKYTRNFLALKFSHNSTYILNGDWKLGASRSIEAGGTKVTYVRQDGTSLESILAPGPLSASLDIMIVNHQANPGVKYRYALPLTDDSPIIAPPLIKLPTPSDFADGVDTIRKLDAFAPNASSFHNQRDEAKPSLIYPGQRRTRLRRRNFHWKVTGLTPCSKTCGGGTQTYIRACYRTISSTHQVPISEKRCAHLDAPALTPIPCNLEPCGTSAYWDGAWGQCSVSCGEGVQQFIPQCKLELHGKPIVVSEAQCGPEKPGPQSRRCQERECDSFNDNNELPQTAEERNPKKEWTVGAWSQCSVTCGTGHRTRSVICPSGQCHPENRPAHAEYCHQGTCESPASPSQSDPSISSRSSQKHYSSWLVTEWSHCSEQCGTGNQTRFALCEHDDICSPESKPELSRACSSERHCDGQWFAGPWGECSGACNGPAKQTREVLCIAKIRGVPHVSNEMVCSVALKPYEEQSCLGDCPPQWFASDWGKCEGNCPSGVQRREVRCLDIDARPSSRCLEDKAPVAKRSCTCEAIRENRDSYSYKLAQDEPIDRTCVDRISKCRLAVQARLCSYPFYTKNCCESCSRARHDLFE